MRDFILCVLIGLTSVAVSVAAKDAAPSTANNAAPTPAQQIPLEHFTKFDEFGTIKISPDGEYIAATAGKRGRSTLTFISLKDGKVTGGIRTDANFEIDEFYWTSNTRVVYSLLEHIAGKSTPGTTGEFMAIDRDSKNQKLIYGFRAPQSRTGSRMQRNTASYAIGKLISTLPNDDKNILIAEHELTEGASYWYYSADTKPIVSIVDTMTGAKKRLGTVPLAQAELIVDNLDQVRFAIGADDMAHYKVLWKPTAESAWTEFSLPGFEDESIEPLVFGKDNQSVYFTGVAEDQPLNALYLLDLKTHAVEKVFAFADQEVTNVIRNLSDREIIGVFGYKDKLSHHWLNDKDPTAKLYEALVAAFPKQDVSIVSR